MCSDVCECGRRKNKISSSWNHENHEQTEGNVISKKNMSIEQQRIRYVEKFSYNQAETKHVKN